MAKRILQVITDRTRRGAQVFAWQLQDELASLGWDVETVALEEGGADGGLPVEALGRAWRHPAVGRAFYRRARQADIVVGHGSHTLMVGAAATPRGTPFIYRQVSDSLFWADTRVKRLRVAAALKRARRVVALYPGSASTLIRHLAVRPSKIDVIPNGVHDLWGTSAPPAPDAPPRVLFVGALAREKGCDLAIRAVGGVPDAHLEVVGDGPDRDRLHELADDVAPGRITFSGALADMRGVYERSVVVLLTSRSDSMPAVLIEAGLAQRPVLATRVGGIPEIVEDGVTGRLLERADPDDFRDALARLLSDRPTVAAMGSAGRQHCSRLTVAQVSRAWHAVLTQALNDAA